MSCDRHTNAIVDHACGAEIAAEAAAHLNACATCRQMFHEQRHLLQDLDERLALALSIEPSPRFVPVALARVDRSAFHVRQARWWGGAAAAAAVLLISTLGPAQFGERRAGERQAAPAPASAPSTSVVEHTPSAPAPSTIPDAPSRPADERRRVARRQSVVDRARLVEADVVVPASKSRALARYLALVRGGALDTPTLDISDGTGVVTPAELVIVPLAVDTLALTDVKDVIGPVSRREPGTR